MESNLWNPSLILSLPALFLPALLGGCLVALLAAPLGAFLVWRKQAFFSDALSHGALLGVALGLVLGVSLTWSVALFCIALAALLVVLQKQNFIANDALLGIVAHFTLALGLVIASMSQHNVDLIIYLLGDILSIQWSDLPWMLGVALLVLLVVMALWHSFLAVIFDPELAQVEGLPVFSLQLILMTLTALVVALAIKIVGALLITALMIIPVTTARYWAKTPEAMVIIGAGIGCLSLLLGLGLSLSLDAPAGPSIVVAAGLLFFITTFFKALSSRS